MEGMGYVAGQALVTAGTAFGYAAAGAVVGAAAGGIMTGTMDGAIAGARAGAISGAVAGAALGLLGPGTTSARMLSGGINGAMQGGGAEGALRGMAAGAIPADMGFDRYYSDAGTNTVINVVRDGISGYIIGGARGARINAAGGLINNAVGHLYGQVNTGGSKPTFSKGAWRYKAKSLYGANAITLGNVITYERDRWNAGTERHELDHINIQNALGVSYLPVQAVSQWFFGSLGMKQPMEYSPLMPNYPYDENNRW